jgi:transposase
MAVELKQQKSECCTETHGEHLCYFMSQGFHLSDEQEFKTLIEDAKFRCDHCGHHAKSDANLCVPVSL